MDPIFSQCSSNMVAGILLVINVGTVDVLSCQLSLDAVWLSRQWSAQDDIELCM